MKFIDKNDQKDADFISGVWQKITYLEYIKNEEELVKQNNKKLLIKKLKIGTYLFAAAQFILLPVLLTIGLNMLSIVIIGIVALSESILYEYIQNINIRRGFKYEN
jgi:hypothetical protein